MDLIVLVVAIFSILLLLFSTLSSTVRARKHLPPGPTKLPIIGNLHNMIGSSPHRTLRRLSRKHGPLMHLQLGEFSALVVSSPEMAREILTKNDMSFASRPNLLSIEVCTGGRSGNITFAPYGEYWRQMRKICVLELLSNKRVQSFSSIREEEIQRIVDSIRSSSESNLPINLTERIMDYVCTTISRVTFGRKYDLGQAATLSSKLKESIHLSGGFGIADLYPSVKILRFLSPSMIKTKRLFKDIDATLQNMVDKHISESITTEEETEDLVDVLLRLQKSGDNDVPITTTNIKAIMTDMFAGGTETTSATIEWAMSEMVKHPRVMAKAQAEIRHVLKGKKIIKEEDIQGMDYLKLVIKETLRLHPPVPLLLPRECREPCVVSGFQIPIKTKVLVNAWAIGRDPKFWENPNTFYPERFLDTKVDLKGINNSNYEFIPFGAGRRMCPGIAFGLSSVELALTQLLYHFDWNLPNHMKPEELDMTELFGAGLSRKFDLLFMAVPYIPIVEC